MKTWSEYYTLCKSKYEGNKSATVYDLGLEVLGDQINFDENFYSTVSRLSKGVKESILENHEIQANAKSVKSTKNFISDIRYLCDFYYRNYLEDCVFGSYVYCDNIKIYETPVGLKDEKSSWLWHLDNNPREQIKILMYLTDVEEGSGPFTYLSDPHGRAVKASTRRVDHKNWCTSKGLHASKFCSWHSSRVSAHAMDTMIKNGCNEVPVYGKIGTSILFDNNIIHKGSLPKIKPRVAITMQFRPVDEKRDSLVGAKYTGDGWKHTTFNMNPDIVTNVRK